MPAARHFGLDRPLAGANPDVPNQPALALDSGRLFTRQEPMRGNLHGHPGFRQRSARFSLKHMPVGLMDGVARPLPVDECVPGQAEPVSPLLAEDGNLRRRRDRREAAAQAADQRIEGDIPGIGDFIAPDRLGQIAAPDRAAPVEDQIDPEPSDLAAWEPRLADDDRPRFDRQLAADRDSWWRGRRPRTGIVRGSVHLRNLSARPMQCRPMILLTGQARAVLLAVSPVHGTAAGRRFGRLELEVRVSNSTEVSTMKTLACGDLAPGCAAVLEAETEEEIPRIAAKHAVEDHGLSVDEALVAAVKSAIRDEEAGAWQRMPPSR